MGKCEPSSSVARIVREIVGYTNKKDSKRMWEEGGKLGIQKLR
jgi:hypothetical protein